MAYRSYLSFYQRLCSIHDVLNGLRSKCEKTPKHHRRLAGILWKHIGDTISDPALKKAAHRMEEKAVVFDRLRQGLTQPHWLTRSGFWKPEISSSFDKFLKYGDFKKGFAQVRCGDCKEES